MYWPNELSQTLYEPDLEALHMLGEQVESNFIRIRLLVYRVLSNESSILYHLLIELVSTVISSFAQS
jgi:hypothetical protein